MVTVLMGISYVIFLEATNIDAFALQQNYFNALKKFCIVYANPYAASVTGNHLSTV
jgi:hypothetical protein